MKYKTASSNKDWASVLRRVLIGEHGERTMFHVRYFEIAPGGYTSFERHGHEHAVICIRGTGKCRVGKRIYALGFLDTIYVPPFAPHRLTNDSEEPFGFICVVDSTRDRPENIE